MAVFEISGPDGTVYEVEADTIEAAAAAVSSMGSGEKSWGQTLKENILGDDDPTTQNTGEKIGSWLNKAGEAMTFGLVGDEAAGAVDAALGRGSYEERRDHYRDQEELLRKEHPIATFGAELVGGMALPIGAVGSLRHAPGLWNKAKVAGASAGATGALSAVYGGMEGETPEDRAEMAKWAGLTGAGVGAAIPIAGGLVQKGANALKNRNVVRDLVRSAPSTDSLRASGQALYRQVDDAGVSLKPEAVRRQMDDISQYLRSEGAGYTGAEKVMPASRAIMDATGDVGAKSNTVPFDELDMFRRYMGNAAGSNIQNKGDTRVATEALGKLDDFVRNLGEADVDAGDVRVLRNILPKARDTWARMSRSQLIDDAIEAGDQYLSGPGTGIKYQFKRILKNDKLSRGFSDAEKALMKRVVNGTVPERLLRLAGSGLSQIGGTVAAFAGGGPIAGMAALGGSTGARALSDRVIAKNAETVRAVVAAGGLPKMLPASDKARRIAEQLLRTGTAVAQD